MPGYIAEGEKCLKIRVNISGICEHNWQCNGTELANVCDNGLCVCNSGYIQIGRNCYKGYLTLNDPCELTEQCMQRFSVCVNRSCKCKKGYSVFDKDSCLKVKVNIGGICEHNWQCNGTELANVCDDRLCVCNSGYIQNEKKCYKGYLTLNDPCELTEQCMQPFSGCFNRSCQCKNGYSAFDTDSCLKVRVNISGICEHNWQCNGTEFANVCDNGLCVCNSGYIQIDWKCHKGYLTLNDPCELTEQCMQPFSGCFNRSCQCKNGYSAFDTDSCLKDTNNGVTFGTLFGGLMLGVIVIAVIMTLTYRRLKFPTRKIQEPDVMFADNRTYGTARGCQTSFLNNTKQKVATVSIYSFAKETPGCNLPGKQQNERTEDVYNHLHEQTEHDDDTYDHACTAPNHGTDLSEYSHSRDIATVQSTSPFLDGGDYSTLGQ
ncbi:prion-like-(Q/N-rich) domain-bearing protein 25 [Magallana gigas]|uniref:prion-like-(Q/N-rich) domain-bearing protein 25 n=1 Tax=Magallana gigas TaxID=29159 RepID=UPI00333E384A